MKTPKTNAMRLLETMGIAYTCHTYSTADGAIDGPAVAAKTGRDPGTVFKTLAARGVGGGLCVFCLPVNQELNLKKAAAAAGEKRVEMLAVAQITAATGYVRGGVSPLGMKKAWPTFLEESALKQESILVSGGRIGLQIELAPADLLKATNVKVFANE